MNEEIYMKKPIDVTVGQTTFFNQVFLWMGIGLSITAVFSYISLNFMISLYRTPGMLFLFPLLSVGLVMGLSASAQKLKPGLARALFIVYSALMGLSLSPIFLMYQLGSIVSVFFITSGMFLGLAVFGYVTKRNLSGIGRVAMMGVWGLVLTGIWAMIFGASDSFFFIRSVFGVAIFSILTAWDMQKLKAMAQDLQYQGADQNAIKSYGILGALTLYLDFINLFIFLLRIFGSRRN